MSDAMLPGSPDADGWISWPGGDCPVPPDTEVDFRLRDHLVGGKIKADKLVWKHGFEYGGSNDIVAYRIVTPAPPKLSPPAFAIGALNDEQSAELQCLMADRRCAGSRCLGWVRFDDQNGAGNCVHLIAGMRSLR